MKARPPSPFGDQTVEAQFQGDFEPTLILLLLASGALYVPLDTGRFCCQVLRYLPGPSTRTVPTAPNPHIPTADSNGHHQVTPVSPTTPTDAITASPAITVTTASTGFHVAGAGLSLARGSSEQPITSTTSPVSASGTTAHSGRVAHHTPVSGSGAAAPGRRGRAAGELAPPSR